MIACRACRSGQPDWVLYAVCDRKHDLIRYAVNDRNNDWSLCAVNDRKFIDIYAVHDRVRDRNRFTHEMERSLIAIAMYS